MELLCEMIFVLLLCSGVGFGFSGSCPSHNYLTLAGGGLVEIIIRCKSDERAGFARTDGSPLLINFKKIDSGIAVCIFGAIVSTITNNILNFLKAMKPILDSCLYSYELMCLTKGSASLLLGS